MYLSTEYNLFPMKSIKNTFSITRSEKRPALIAYLTVGHPSITDTPSLVKAAINGGADIIELGIPFSDPLAEGPTIQRSSAAALTLGVTPETCLETCATLRDDGVETPIILMGYYNPILAYGVESFITKAARAGVNGLIIVDLPPEEGEAVKNKCTENDLDLVMLLTPTSTNERIERISAQASGFIYCVSITGVTGARSSLPTTLPTLVQRIRERTDLPIAIGFGISQREHIQSLAKYADGAVVGSAIIDAIDRATPEERVNKVQEFMKTLSLQ